MNTFLIKAAGLVLVTALLGWGLHSWLGSIRAEGRAEVQALWDADKAAAAEAERKQDEANKTRAAKALAAYTKNQAEWSAKLKNAQNEITQAAKKLESCTIEPSSVRLLDCLADSSAQNCAAL
jgi:multidrug resistance efflux pump